MKKIIILSITVLSLISCGASIGRMCSSIEAAIPKEIFANKDEVLLVIEGDDAKVNRKATKLFAERYKGKYLMIDESKLDNSKYADLDKYRYTFIIDIILVPTSVTSQSGNVRYFDKKTPRYSILDRKTNTTYKPNCWSGSYVGNLKGYIDNLNKKLGVE